MVTRIMHQSEFIESVFIQQIDSLLGSHPYHAFLLMCSAIEMLGALFDTHDLIASGQSEIRFRTAFTKLFDKKYANAYVNKSGKPFDLWKELRCPLLHTFAPSPRIGLASKDEGKHMAVVGDMLTLKVEDFFNDFAAACRNAIQVTEKRKFPIFDNNDKFRLRVPVQ